MDLKDTFFCFLSSIFLYLKRIFCVCVYCIINKILVIGAIYCEFWSRFYQNNMGALFIICLSTFVRFCKTSFQKVNLVLKKNVLQTHIA